MDEENFPRGCGDKKADSSQKKASVKRKREEDILFKDDKAASGKKTKKQKNKEEKRSKQQKLSKDERDDKELQYLAEDLGVGEELNAQSDTNPRLKRLSPKTISEDMLLMGVVKEVHEYEIVVSLPKLMTGYVQITDVSSTYTKLLENLSDDQMDPMDDQQKMKTLQDLYEVGSHVTCKVKSLGSTKQGYQRIHLTLDPQAVHGHLTLNMLQPGMVITGNVISVEDHGYVIDVGVSGVNSFLSNRDAETFIKMKNQGQPLFTAQPIKCLIKEVKANGRSLVLTANPKSVAKATASRSSHDNLACLLPGTKVKATVVKVFKDNFNASVLSSYTGCVDELHFEAHNLEPSQFKVKQEVQAYVIYNCPQRKSLGLSLMGAHLASSSPDIQLPFQGLNPGDILKKAKVIRIREKNGLLLQLNEQDRGFVHMSHVSDERIENLHKFCSIGSSVTCRILDFNLMDRVATVSLKKSVLTKPFLGYHDIHLGALVEGTVTAILEKGLCVKVSDHVTGFVPNAHMADVIIHKPHSKFTVGELLQLRVLCVNPKRRRLLLTHKNSLVNSTLPIVTSYEQLRKDMVLHGVIISIRDFGYLVRFFNDVTGLIPRSELSSGQEPIADDSYFVGQVVKCRVVRTFPPESKRIILSLRLSVTEVQRPRDFDYQNPNMGKLTDVQVFAVRDMGLEVLIQPEGTLAFIPKVHLSDFDEICGLMSACYQKGDTITGAMHWSVSPVMKCPVLTLKPMLIQASDNEELIHSFSEVQPGTLVMGVVKKVMPYGIFTELPNNVVGLAPKSAMSDDFISDSNMFHVGQTLRARVTEVDLEKSRFLLSLKSSTCHPRKGEGQSLMEQYFHDRDVVMEKLAQKEDWKKLLEAKIGRQATVRITKTLKGQDGVLCELRQGLSGYIAYCHIGDQTLVEQSKVKACILHVNLNAKMVEVCVDPDVLDQIVPDAKTKKTSNPDKRAEGGAATVVMVKDDIILVCLKSNGKLVYIPGKRHINDIRTGDDLLTVGQTIKINKQREISGRLCASQCVRKRKEKQPASKSEDESGEKKEKKGRKMAGEIIEARSLQLGQKVTAVVKSVHESQLNVRINNEVLGRVHATEVTDKMVQNKFPLRRFKEGMKVEAKVIGHREIKNHNYLPITHTNFTKLVLELSTRPSKLNDDSYTGEDDTLENQLKTFQVGQTVHCVVQRYADNILWVTVSSLLRGKVYQLNLSENIGVLEHPANYFIPGSVRQAAVIKVDQQHQLLELTFIGNCSKELSPGTVTNGRILKVLSGVGLVIQLPHGLRGRVSLTDLRDHFTEDPLKGYKEKQFLRCCVLEITSADNIALSLRPSAVSKHHDPAIDRNLESIKDLKVGEIVKGYVKNVSKVGVFVSLSRKVQGRIQLKNLSVSFVKEPETFFQKGKLLTVKVLSIDQSSKKIELSSSSADTEADDPVPKKHRTPKPVRGAKRKRRDSQDDESDSGLEEPETLSDSEVEVTQKPAEDAPVQRLQVTSGFSWESSLNPKGKMVKALLLGNKDDDSSSDEEEEEEEVKQDEPPVKKSKKEQQAEDKAEEEKLYKMEREMLDDERPPETAEEFDRLVLSSPNSSLVWVRYMAFHLHSAEIDKARAVAERALKTIGFREEQEKLNVWVAFLNLENLYGTEESLLKVFERALKHCEPLKVFQNLVNIYSHTGKLEQAEQLYNSMVKRFNLQKEVWISYGYFLMQNGRHDATHKLMQRSFKSLTQKEHIDVIVKFAQMEFKFGEEERGKTMFENVLSNYPKRTDIWSVYLDMMIKQADLQAIRHLFERVIHLSLSAKKMKFFFKRYLEFEKKCGTEADVAEVKRKAVEYVESKMVVDSEST